MQVSAQTVYTGTAAQPLAITSVTTATTKFLDGSIGDTSTGEAGAANAKVIGLFDLGSGTLTGVNKMTASFSGMSCGGTATLYGSNTGADGSWTTVTSSTAVSGGTLSLSFTSATFRYWELVLVASLSGAIVNLTDYRLYDASTAAAIAAGSGGTTAAPTTSPTVVATSGAGGNKVTISGTIPSGATGYIVAKNNNTVGDTTGQRTVVANFTANGDFYDTNAPVGTPQYYYAQYQNSGGSGPASAIAGPATATAAPATVTESAYAQPVSGTPYMALNPPSGLTIVEGDTITDMTWTNAANIGGVRLYYRAQVTSGPVNPWIFAGKVVAATAGNPATVPTSFRYTGLTNGTTYDYTATSTP